jgi:DNA-binding response OmpR family regulator
MLELDGHTVRTAIDGATGLAMLTQAPPEAAIVDIGLPGIDGYEVARQSRAAGYGGLLIALSGYGQERDIRHSSDAGFDAYLIKPVDATALMRLLAPRRAA